MYKQITIPLASLSPTLPSALEEMSQWMKPSNANLLVEMHRRFWIEDTHRDDLVNVHEDEVADQSDEDQSVEEDDDHGIRFG
jgi:hypothetical protein